MMPPNVRESLSVLSLLGFAGLALLRRWRRIDLAEADRWRFAVRRLLDWHDIQPNGGRYTLREFGDADGYDAWAESYDSHPNALIAREEELVRELIRTLPPGRALDAACGTGRITAHLVAAGHDVVAIDRSVQMMAKARAKVPTAAFHEGALESLPVRDGEFDLATCCLALTHCDDIERPIAELARAVRSGGRLFLSDLHPMQAFLGGDVTFLKKQEERILIRNRFHPHSRYLKAFRMAGLRVCNSHEPAMTQEDVRLVFAARKWGEDAPDVVGIAEAAMIGLPMALVWDLEKI